MDSISIILPLTSLSPNLSFQASNDQRAHNPVDLTGVYNSRLGSLDQHDLELWAIQEVGHKSHSTVWTDELVGPV
ncbi:hypothetical protein TIFTF001_049021 [Ficus carica]|uniref:Uncharacterized protein n=1 Tax=Ficus carica TaxID=3494 RepID=A0AA87ZDK9_FICCA|nr:hypothetical protein TIFTF001_049021 [Ficus carica]